MPQDGSKPRDIASLADEGARFEIAFPVAGLTRLVEQLASPEGSAEGQFGFTREQGLAIADVGVAATVQLVCQRCLGPVMQRLESRSRVVMVASEAEGGRVPPEFETVMAPEGRLSLADLMEEELLLALPISPRHDDVRDCPAAQGTEFAETAGLPAGGEVRTPFANLGTLLGRGPDTEREPRGKRRR